MPPLVWLITHKRSWPGPLALQASSRPRWSRNPRQSGCRNSWSVLCSQGTQRSRQWSVCSQWSGPELSLYQNLWCGWPGGRTRGGVIWASSKRKRKKKPLPCVRKRKSLLVTFHSSTLLIQLYQVMMKLKTVKSALLIIIIIIKYIWNYK